MLDVHPPHHPTHTWTDFFIHIATIVVGLLIAVGLEQTVEYFHHREQRARLLEDLRHEAEIRVDAIHNNIRVHAEDEQWRRDTLQAALDAKPSGGIITFTVPPAPPDKDDFKPESAVWDAAKASGLASVLDSDEIEGWSRDNLYSELTQRRVETWNMDSRSLRAIADHLGITLTPGATVHVTPAGRDELTRALGLVIEDTHAVNLGDASTAGSSAALLHGARTIREMGPYINAELHAVPR